MKKYIRTEIIGLFSLFTFVSSSVIFCNICVGNEQAEVVIIQCTPNFVDSSKPIIIVASSCSKKSHNIDTGTNSNCAQTIATLINDGFEIKDITYVESYTFRDGIVQYTLVKR